MNNGKRMRPHGGRLAVFMVAIVAIVAGLVPGTALPASADPAVPHEPQQARPVHGRSVRVLAREADKAAAHALHGNRRVRWPAAGSSEATLQTAGGGQRKASAHAASPVRAGSLPVRVSRAHTPARAGARGAAPHASAPAVSKLRVTLLDRQATRKAHVRGELLQLRRTDGHHEAGRVHVSLDYSGFAHAYGGDWASRLRLVRLPACALRTPAKPGCRDAQVVPSSNNTDTQRLTAQPLVAGSTSTPTLYAAEAAPSGSTGDYTATSLSPAGKWQVSAQTGTFSWSYPMNAPPVPGGLVPNVTLGYSSSAVDGRTVSTNNQPGWIGEGWQYWPGYIERQYASCADDTAGGLPKTGDQCWKTDNAVLSLAGHTTVLVKDKTTGDWRLKDDDGSRVEHLTGGVNGDDNGEYWKVTTVDGTQYFFGRNRLPGWTSGKPETKSVWTAPVFGNDAGEPCHGSDFAHSWCQQAYRWNLDYVVDPHNDSLSYWYAQETNKYGLNLAKSTASYVRGGTLLRAEYGTRKGQEYAGNAPARVVFTTADRCVAGADCSQHTGTAWPDVPWDQSCTGSTCPGKYAPTFWSTKRLSSVTTQIWSGSAYTDVDSWQLDQSFPKPGDGTSASLWLHGITRTGHTGGTASLPEITFSGVALPNRVNAAADGLPPMDKYRISAINTAFGGVISPHYIGANCDVNALPKPESNTTRCFPVWWSPPEAGPTLDWFTKYAVDQLTQVDRVGNAPTEVTSYDYEGGAAWAYNDNPLTPPDKRTWSQWRGYGKVRVRHGDPNTGSDPQSAVETRYFRGMNGDHLPGGGTRQVSITDSQGHSWPDDEQLAGMARETIVYNGVGGPVVTDTITDPWSHGPTASDGTDKAYVVRPAKQVVRTALSGGGWRTTEVDTSYDNLGLPTRVSNLGDVATTDDDQCTTTTYAQNSGTWLMTLTKDVSTVAVACGTTPGADQWIGETRTYYDGHGLNDVPSAGDVTKAEQLADVADGGAKSFVTESRAEYDNYGRTTASWDALGHQTTNSYTPATGLPAESTTTNPLGFATTTTIDPARGVPSDVTDANGWRTSMSYDPLGRLTGVWEPGRSKERGFGPNLRFSYQVRSNGASWAATDRLTANGNYLRSYQLYDGLGRKRQTQAPAWDGGRVLTDIQYDSRGLPYKSNGEYYAPGAPSGDLFFAPDNQVYRQTLNRYDGAGRLIATINRKLGVERWRTSTAYGGDHVTVTPPAGGIATATYTNARGKKTELRRFHGSQPTGDYESTRYTYTPGGQLASVTDDAGNAWRYTYDLRGRQTKIDDPDKGTSTFTYDDADELRTATDARGKTVVYDYDALGRKVSERTGSADGPQVLSWTYDTLAKGKLTSWTRYADGNAYTSAVTGYDDAGRPKGTSLTVPWGEPGLAGRYTTSMTYRPDGSLDTVSLPRIGDLSPETLTYDYDSLALPATLSGSQDYVSAMQYTRFGEPSQYQLGSTGMRVWDTLYYDENTRRVTESLVEREYGQTRVDDTKYAYDPAGNVTRIDDAFTGAATDSRCFHYDGLRRLTEAWSTTASSCGAPGSQVGGPAPFWQSYQYDAAGNRTKRVDHGLAGAADTTSTYHYPAAGGARPHAVSSVDVSGPDGQHTDSYGYDAAGNTASRPGPVGVQTLTWDALGELASITQGGKASTRVYDASGNLLIRRDGDGAKTLFLASGEVHVSASGTRTGTRFYSFAGRTVASRTLAGGVHWLFGDLHGTSMVSVTAGTLQAAVRRFDPFGRRVARSQPAGRPTMGLSAGCWIKAPA